jgi:hypothetical protein
MPRRPRRTAVQDVRASRPASPYLSDGRLDPREWQIACSAAGVLTLVLLREEPWFLAARPIEVHEQGVQLEVVVRWLSSEVFGAVPLAVDGYPVHVVLEGEDEEVHPVH